MMRIILFCFLRYFFVVNKSFIGDHKGACPLQQIYRGTENLPCWACAEQIFQFDRQKIFRSVFVPRNKNKVEMK